VLHRTTSEMK